MPTLKLDGDAQGAVKATADVAKGYDAIRKAARDADKEAAKLEQTAKRILRDNETNQQKYNRKWEELALLVKRGKLTIDEAAVALTRYRREAEGAQRSNLAAFGQSALSAMSGVLGAGGIIALGVRALSDYNSELDSILDKLKSRSGGVAQLAQFAINSKNPEATFKSLVSEARAAQGATATGDLNDAANLVGSLKGAGLNKRDRSYLIGLQSRQVIESATDLAPSIAAFQSAYPGLTAKQIIGKALGTADVGSSKLHELVREVGPAAVGASMMGYDENWVMAAGGIMDRALSSASEGATRLTQYQKQLRKFGFKNYPEMRGMGELEALDFISAHTGGGSNFQALEKFLGGRGEATEFFGVMAKPENRAILERQIAKAERAESQGLADRFADLPKTVDFLSAGEQMRQSEGMRSDSLIDTSTVPGLFRSVINQQLSSRRKKYESGEMNWFSAALGELIFNVGPSLGRAVPGQLVERTKLATALGDPEITDDLKKDIIKKLDEIAQTNRSMDAKTPRRQPVGRAE